jgi:hypothetical protein
MPPRGRLAKASQRLRLCMRLREGIKSVPTSSPRRMASTDSGARPLATTVGMPASRRDGRRDLEVMPPMLAALPVSSAQKELTAS